MQWTYFAHIQILLYRWMRSWYIFQFESALVFFCSANEFHVLFYLKLLITWELSIHPHIFSSFECVTFSVRYWLEQLFIHSPSNSIVEHKTRWGRRRFILLIAVVRHSDYFFFILFHYFSCLFAFFRLAWEYIFSQAGIVDQNDHMLNIRCVSVNNNVVRWRCAFIFSILFEFWMLINRQFCLFNIPLSIWMEIMQKIHTQICGGHECEAEMNVEKRQTNKYVNGMRNNTIINRKYLHISAQNNICPWCCAKRWLRSNMSTRPCLRLYRILADSFSVCRRVE